MSREKLLLSVKKKPLVLADGRLRNALEERVGSTRPSLNE
jgi:hypothetical protein